MATTEAWQERLRRAAAAGLGGDLLVLADEAPTAALRAAAWVQAARALREAGQSALALEQLERALALDADDAEALREQALCRQVLGSAAPAVAGRGQPGRVFLFSGHMIDAAGRAPPRFPAEKAPAAAQRIAAALDGLAAGPDDLALTQGACGGDLLFSEACLQRSVRLFWLQPYREAEFIQASVLRGGEDWRRRYLAARSGLAAPPRAAPDAFGPPPPASVEGYAYERCNRWLLYTALAWGAARANLICLWNGERDDGPGGTAQMVEEFSRRSGKIIRIDTRDL